MSAQIKEGLMSHNKGFGLIQRSWKAIQEFEVGFVFDYEHSSCSEEDGLKGV